MKKGKEFIFPENVDKDYGIWKDYTLKDFGYAVLTGLIGVILIAVPPYGLILILIKIVIVVLAMTVVMAILTIRPVSSRRNIKVRDHFKMKRRYANRQKLFYLKTKKRGDFSALEQNQTKQ
ncbi:conjugal transfer protein [Oenococcus kitaharae]|uniref:conjugal transfer protein n=1 Tax=Oenococcus kitaharae TaxID=336988 RepID=UPI00086311A7|nr:conjugal transfer protein [Oenococcus kitaharae]OEY84304.1 conjugal transfer protein [Oenococcus kitaharae]